MDSFPWKFTSYAFSLKSLYKLWIIWLNLNKFLQLSREYNYLSLFLCRIHDLQESDWQQQPGLSSVFESRFVSIVFLDLVFESGFQVALLENGKSLHCIEDLFKTCLEDTLKTCLEDLFKTSWRQAKCLLRISVSHKFRFVSEKSISHKSMSDNSKTCPKCII